MNETVLKHIRELQWSGKYWGPTGALALAKEYLDTVSQNPLAEGATQENRDFQYQMMLASLNYSAGGSAWSRRWSIGVMLWLFRAMMAFRRAVKHARTAKEILVKHQGKINTVDSDYDVLQSVFRKWSHHCGKFFLLSEARTTLEDASWAIERGLQLKNVSKLSHCFLWLGKTDIDIRRSLQCRPVNVRELNGAFQNLLSIWDGAMRIPIEGDEAQQNCRQLSRVYRQLAELVTQVVPHVTKSRDIDDMTAEDLAAASYRKASDLAASSKDQQIKLAGSKA